MKTLIEMAQEIVLAQASTKAMSTEEMKTVFQGAFDMLKSMQEREVGTEETGAKPVIDPKKSIQKNKIICLECGEEFKMLTSKHLASHGLDAKSYRKKYGFSSRQALCAKVISKRHSEVSKARGIPEKMQAYLDSRRKKTEEA